MDIFDLDASGLLRAHEVADLTFGHFKRHGMPIQRVVGEQAIDRALEIATEKGQNDKIAEARAVLVKLGDSH